FVSAGLDLVSGSPSSILDPGCGDGIWCAEARRRWPAARIDAVEVQTGFIRPPEVDLYHRADFNAFEPGRSFDLICGNPPYKEAVEWVRKCLRLLAFGG